MKKSTLAVLFLLLFNASLHAGDIDITVAQYKAGIGGDEQTVETLKVYISAIGEGLKWSNVILGTQKRELLYCVPEKLGLDADNYISALDQEIQANHVHYSEASLNKMPVGIVLVFGLRHMFPCNAK